MIERIIKMAMNMQLQLKEKNKFLLVLFYNIYKIYVCIYKFVINNI